MLCHTHGIDLQCTALSEPPCYKPVSAGVIIFSISPTNNMYILLGKESYDDLWCDFGGRLNCGESVAGGAAREFSEESLCVVDFFVDGHIEFAHYTNKFRQTLEQQDFYLRIDILIKKDNGVDQVKVYFLKQVPWQPHIDKTFISVRNQLTSSKKFSCPIQSHPCILPDQTLDYHWFEKKSLRWWSTERLKEVLKNNGKYKEHRFRKSFLPVLNIALSELSNF